jgi:hypothetical protein
VRWKTTGFSVAVRADLGEHETLLTIAKARRLFGYEPVYGWRDAEMRAKS